MLALKRLQLKKIIGNGRILEILIILQTFYLQIIRCNGLKWIRCSSTLISHYHTVDIKHNHIITVNYMYQVTIIELPCGQLPFYFKANQLEQFNYLVF